MLIKPEGNDQGACSNRFLIIGGYADEVIDEGNDFKAREKRRI